MTKDFVVPLWLWKGRCNRGLAAALASDQRWKGGYAAYIGMKIAVMAIGAALFSESFLQL
jgi:hypothetical protein